MQRSIYAVRYLQYGLIYKDIVGAVFQMIEENKLNHDHPVVLSAIPFYVMANVFPRYTLEHPLFYGICIHLLWLSHYSIGSKAL